MSIPATNRPLFRQSEAQVLERGLNTMTVACEALTSQVKFLTKELNELQEINDQLNNKLDLYKTIEAPE